MCDVGGNTSELNTPIAIQGRTQNIDISTGKTELYDDIESQEIIRNGRLNVQSPEPLVQQTQPNVTPGAIGPNVTNDAMGRIVRFQPPQPINRVLFSQREIYSGPNCPSVRGNGSQNQLTQERFHHLMHNGIAPTFFDLNRIDGIEHFDIEQDPVRRQHTPSPRALELNDDADTESTIVNFVNMQRNIETFIQSSTISDRLTTLLDIDDETHDIETHDDKTHDIETHDDETHDDETHDDETHDDETHEFSSVVGENGSTVPSETHSDVDLELNDPEDPTYVEYIN